MTHHYDTSHIHELELTFTVQPDDIQKILSKTAAPSRATAEPVAAAAAEAEAAVAAAVAAVAAVAAAADAESVAHGRSESSSGGTAVSSIVVEV